MMDSFATGSPLRDERCLVKYARLPVAGDDSLMGEHRDVERLATDRRRLRHSEARGIDPKYIAAERTRNHAEFLIRREGKLADKLSAARRIRPLQGQRPGHVPTPRIEADQGV